MLGEGLVRKEVTEGKADGYGRGRVKRDLATKQVMTLLDRIVINVDAVVDGLKGWDRGKFI